MQAVEQAVERAVEHVIEAIHENYGEELCIDDLARTARYSKFHFTRIFQRTTGLTPGRFLSAVRLQKAKQLLTSTSLTVTDISHMVGYTSVGTFSSRFAYSVGVPPRTYRRLGGRRPWRSFPNGRSGGGPRVVTHSRSTVRGTISCTDTVCAGPVFVGLFPGRIPQGEPVRCAVLPRTGPYVLDDVPPGTWYAVACCPQGRSGGPGTGPGAAADGCEGMAIGYHGPITMHSGVVRIADLKIRPACPLDPPVLLALPDMRADMVVANLEAVA
ncbi:AraC family transcriptional regulator [Micromonospora sp. NPDC050686]|uniref:AraC family transcriptional regulator n=1 Tax=Micromonospora sp. NPDC050686 TaxID=3154631 RepID=UPI0033C90BF7